MLQELIVNALGLGATIVMMTVMPISAIIALVVYGGKRYEMIASGEKTWKEKIAKFGGKTTTHFEGLDLLDGKVSYSISVIVSVPARYARRFWRFWGEAENDYAEIVAQRANEILNETLSIMFGDSPIRSFNRSRTSIREMVTMELTKEFAQKGILINQVVIDWNIEEKPEIKLRNIEFLNEAAIARSPQGNRGRVSS